VLPVAVTTAAGWDEEAFESLVRRSVPTLAYLLPDLHNPTGRSMPSDQRARVLALAEDFGTVLVVDETTAELGIERTPSPPMAAWAAREDAVVTIGSLAKSVWGGLRIGWIRADPSLVRRFLAARSVVDLGTPIIEQLTAAEIVKEMPAVLADRSARLREGRDALTSLLADRLPEWDVPRVDGGLALWVGLGRPVSSRLAIASRSHGVAIAAGPRFGLDGAFERFLRVPFTADRTTIELAVDGLAAAWHSLGSASARTAEPLLTPVV
jgi:DNA-binding transcriptional MocR family regulator